MISTRIHDLILVSADEPVFKRLADWQIAKLKIQAKKWQQKKLVSFYDSLFRVEVANKNNQTCYSLKQALDILFNIYL